MSRTTARAAAMQMIFEKIFWIVSFFEIFLFFFLFRFLLVLHHHYL